MLLKRHGKLLASLSVLTAAVLIVTGCGSDSSSPVGDGTDVDPAPPTAPAKLAMVKAAPDGMMLRWEASPDPDVVGYDLFVFDPNPFLDNSYVKLNTTPLTGTSYLFAKPEAEKEYYFKVRAVDGDGLFSQTSFPALVVWDGGPFEPSDIDDGREPRTRGPVEPDPPDPDWGGEHTLPDDRVGG